MTRMLRLGLVIVAAAVALGGAAASAAAKAKPTLTIGLGVAPASLDAAKDANGPTTILHMLSSAPLTHLNSDGTITGGLATSFRYVGGSGNKVFQLTLRHDARFSNGAPVTAQAVAAWLRYFANAKGPFATDLGPVRSIQTIGRWTVKLTLETPNPILPYLFSQARHMGLVSDVSNPALLSTQTVGAGEYVLVPSQSVSGSQYTFVPNKYYYDRRAIKYSRVTVKVITDPSSLLQAAETGQVDVEMGGATTAAAAAAAGLSVLSAPQGYDSLFLIDRPGRIVKALSDVRVRQALNYAIDRKAITSAIVGKYGAPTAEPLSTDGYVKKYETYYPYDPAKAKALLTAAGYPDGFTLPVLVFGASGTLGDPMVQAVASYLARVGVNIQTTTAATIGEFIGDLFSGKWAAVQLTQAPLPGSLFYQQCVKPGAILNPFGFNDQQMDKLFVKAIRLQGAAATALWQKLIVRVTTQAWLVPVLKYDQLFYVSKRVGGVVVTEGGFVPDPTSWFPTK